MARVIQTPPDMDTEARVSVPQLAADLLRWAGPDSESERLVQVASRRYGGWTLKYGLSSEDITQAAYTGLVLAAKRYDPDRGTQFFGYAWHFVAGEVRHLIRTWIRDYRRFGQLVSLENRQDDDGEDIFREEDFILPPSLSSEEQLSVIDAVERLSPLQRAVITHLFFMDLSQPETARRLGYSQKHVSRVMHQALRKLRETFGGTNPRKRMRGRHSQEQNRGEELGEGRGLQKRKEKVRVSGAASKRHDSHKTPSEPDSTLRQGGNGEWRLRRFGTADPRRGEER